MNYDEAVAWLYATQMHGIRPGLERIRRLIEVLGVRTDSAKFLHVAGTNGKGSVCAMLDAICRTDGRRTGLFTSPHLVTFRERIRVDGEMISEAEVARGISELRDHTANWEDVPTFFELATALALAHFERSDCEIVVLETGLGGRLDATNVVTPAVTVITPIALDHQQWLGSTVEAIAVEKAGIFKRGVPAVSAPQTPDVAKVLQEHAREIGTRGFESIEERWTGEVNLAGTHQQWNAALAVAALASANLGVSAEAITRGLRDVQWPGRFQRWGDRIVLDGAHNPAAALRLAETWREVFGDAQATLILGILTDKDLHAICTALLPIAARVLTVPVRSLRSCSAEDVAAMIRELEPAIPCHATLDLPTALAEASLADEQVLVCGSLFLVGETLAHLQSQATPPEMSAQ